MRFHSQILQKYITIPVPVKQLANDLTLKTCEVEEIFERKIPDLVVIGKVLDVYKHPNADTLFVTKIDCGPKGVFQICTGGENVTKHSYIPAALPGCHLPVLDMTIGERKMRGEDSNGMICSKREVGFNEDEEHHWIWTLQVSKNPEDYASLPDEWKALQGEFATITDEDCGKSLKEVFPWMESFVLDVDNKTLTHRADLFGHYGLAVEIGAIYQVSSNPPPQAVPLPYQGGNIDFQEGSENSSFSPGKGGYGVAEGVCNTQISLQTPLCSFYGAISGTIKPVDEGVAKAKRFQGRVMLRDLGLQPRHDWVNFSNLYMYMTGQPVHVFDADKISGGITVRQAKNGETFLDLTGKEHILDPQDIVIADDKSVLALAGIYGGLESGVSDTTTRVLIEIAHFDPVQVRKTGMRLGIRTDAQQRYEKYINPVYTQDLWKRMKEEYELDSVLEGIVEILGVHKQTKEDLGDRIIAHGIVCPPNAPHIYPKGIYIPYNLSRCSKLIYGDATSLDEQDFCKVLGGLGFEHIGTNTFLVPLWRSPQDITIEDDLVEEYIRIRGYETVPSLQVQTHIETIEMSQEVKNQRYIEQYLIRQTFHQVETYPRVDSDQIQKSGHQEADCYLIKNPIDANMPYLRPTMLWSMLAAVSKNIQTFATMKLFDTGKIRDKGEEKTALGMIMLGEGADRNQHPFVQLKGMLAGLVTEDLIRKEITTADQIHHPLQQAYIYLGDKKIGHIGTLHPLLLAQYGIKEESIVTRADIYIDDLQLQNTSTSHKYQTNEQQLMRKEAGFLLDRDARYDAVLDASRAVAGVQAVRCIDIYIGEHIPEHKKSITLSIQVDTTGQSGEYANEVLWKVIEEVKALGVEMRG